MKAENLYFSCLFVLLINSDSKCVLFNLQVKVFSPKFVMVLLGHRVSVPRLMKSFK